MMRALLAGCVAVLSAGCGARSGLRVDEGAGGGGTTTRTETSTSTVPPAEVVQIAAAAFTTCVLLDSGDVHCWGRGLIDVPDPDKDENATAPVQILGLPWPTVAISGGTTKICAVSAEGLVHCWGGDILDVDPPFYDGAPDPPASQPLPAPALLEPARSVAGGLAHFCAVLESGAIQCWGKNDEGQLGLGFKSEAVEPPTVVPGLEGVVAAPAGWLHTCAVAGSGALYCWGRNSDGQLGTWDGAESSPVATLVSSAADFVAVAPGVAHTCALDAAGGVHCWGGNLQGQIADGTEINSLYPKMVAGLPAATQIATGIAHTCAALVDGTVRCWGVNGEGECGNGELNPGGEKTPQGVVDLADATLIAAGWEHTCAVVASGGVRCWGANGLGQLGNGAEGPDEGSSVPVDVKGW